MPLQKVKNKSMLYTGSTFIKSLQYWAKSFRILLWCWYLPLEEVAKCDAYSKDDYNRHHEDTDDVAWQTKRTRKVKNVTYKYVTKIFTLLYRVNYNIPSMPRSFFFLGPVCTRWLIPITGCTAATSPREGPDLAGWKLCVEGGVPVELRDSASVRTQSNKASVKQTDKWLLTLYIYFIFYMTSSLADLSLSILILRYSEVTVFWTERDVLIWASLLFVWTAVHAR